MYRFGSTCPPVPLFDLPVDDAQTRSLGADDDAVGTPHHRDGAEPLRTRRVRSRLLLSLPCLATVAAQVDRPKLPDGDARRASHRNRVQTRVVVRLAEAHLL